MVFTKLLSLSQIKRLRPTKLVQVLDGYDVKEGVEAHKLFNNVAIPITQTETIAYKDRFSKLRLLKSWDHYRVLVAKRASVLTLLESKSNLFREEVKALSQTKAKRRIDRLKFIGAEDLDEYKQIRRRLERIQRGGAAADAPLDEKHNDNEQEDDEDVESLEMNSRLFEDAKMREWIRDIVPETGIGEVKEADITTPFLAHINWRLYEFVESVMNTLPLASVSTSKRNALTAACNETTLNEATMKQALRLANPKSTTTHGSSIQVPNRAVLMRAMRFYARPVLTISESAYARMVTALQQYTREVLYTMIRQSKRSGRDALTVCDSKTIAGKVPKNPASHVFSGSADDFSVVTLTLEDQDLEADPSCDDEDVDEEEDEEECSDDDVYQKDDYESTNSNSDEDF